MSKLAENTVTTNMQITEADVEKQKQQQEKEYLGPREMAAYIISGFGDKTGKHSPETICSSITQHSRV